MDAGLALELADARRALDAGDWRGARLILEAVVKAVAPDTRVHAEAAVALSDALWWEGLVDDALEMRRTAYETWRRLDDNTEAARAALWLAREYAGAVGNQPVASGWLARAETLAGECEDPVINGWVALTRSTLSQDPWIRRSQAQSALEVARSHRDGDLEVLALSRLGLALVSSGELDDGLARFDEAMAAAFGRDAGTEILAQACCDLSLATEVSGEPERFAKWSEIVQRVTVKSGHPGLVSFCTVCCAEVLSAAGDWGGAERQLRAAIGILRTSGHRARCVAPESKLAEILVTQGRIEEAEQLVGDDESDASLMVRARIALERGDAKLACLLADRFVRRSGGDSLVTAPALLLAVEGFLLDGDLVKAEAMAKRLDDLAVTTGNRRVTGRAALAKAMVLAAQEPNDDSAVEVEAALDHLTAVAPGAVETARAHLLLARLSTTAAPDIAVAAARSALAGFEKAGASHYADEAAALLRSLGDRCRVGAKGDGRLTDRERDVLRLVAQGLTNSEIAARLYISTKTASNHVSNILTKLGMRSRVEAAAYASLHPDY